LSSASEEKIMAISLAKGANISLEKEAPGLTKARLGLGWDLRATDGDNFDLDVSVFMVKEDGKVVNEGGFIFYNQQRDSAGSVALSGDNRTGEGEGDDEYVDVELAKVPAEIQKLVACVTIHEAESRGQNFGMVSKAFIRVVDLGSDREIARFDLTEDASVNTAMIFGELYRHSGAWKFKAVGQGFQGGLKAMAQSFGLNI
jgi:tellurium resistance protein TerD